jgi:Fic family protein
MDASQFSPEAPGRLVIATDAQGNRGHAFLPDSLAPNIDFGRKAIRLALSEADRELARLDGMAKQIERPNLFFASFIRREALLSSKIEGTHTTLADLIKYEATSIPRTIDDVHVKNYVDAFHYGRKRVAELPVGRVLFNELHSLLMAAYPKEEATAGQFRDCQVFVGAPPFSAARFVPPPDYFLNELMENLERYLSEDDESPLLKLAVAHYQFETIHPYRDGNGRLGRMMISLWLQRAGILTSPMLYLSAYFERRRAAYYDALLRVSTHGDWTNWLVFFLNGIAQQSRDAARRTEVLVNLRSAYHRRVAGPRVSHGVLQLIDSLFDIPVQSIKHASDLLGVTAKPARASLLKLVDAGILRKGSKEGAGVWYYADELIELANMPLDADSQSIPAG